MYTKSIIQQISETLHTKNDFRDMIEQLMEKYTIEDSVFVYANNRYNSIYEVTDGYFVIENEYDNLNDAIAECDVTCMGVRIIDNKTFQTGKVHALISECNKSKKVFDLKRLKDVR